MSGSLTFSSKAWEEYLQWQQTDRSIVKRIHLLVADIQRHPYEGIGKPEPLKHHLAGWWSRRITDEHRIVYRYHEERIEIARLRQHYGS